MYATVGKNKQLYNYIFRRHSMLTKIRDYKKYYKILGIPEDSDQEQIRKAYLDLVKKYHPDSGTKFANAEQFQKIDEAFKILLHKKSKERWSMHEESDVKEQDIKHTAPQHRQYLSYDGVGSGTPFQRQKEYVKVRAIQAADNVLEHRMAKVSAEERALLDKNSFNRVVHKHNIKTKYGFDRLVEDLIQEAMSKGEFSNLSGTGKPLPQHQNTNPYVDFVTHKLNQILIDNGFTPEWISLQKEIREETEALRNSLAAERKYFGPNPLNFDDKAEWDSVLEKHRQLLEGVNKKISKYNLLVPMINQQMILLSLESESEKVLVNGSCSSKTQLSPKYSDALASPGNNADNVESYIVNLIHAIFKK